MFATIYAPNFYLQAALRYQPELRTKPTALLDAQEKKAVIVQLNEAAESVGIRKGMTPSQALARYLQVVIKVRSRAQETLMQKILIHYAFILAPYVEATAPGVCTVQFTEPWHRHLADDSWVGSPARRAYGSERSPCHKVARMVEQLAECDINAQIGIAKTPDSSFFAAHLARPVLQIDDVKKFLAPLPIETLAIA